MKILRKGLYLISLLVLFSGLSAQNFIDLVDISYNQSFANKFSDSASTFNYPGGHISLQYPHVFDNDDVLLGKLSYTHYSISNYNASGERLSYYILYLNIALKKRLSDKVDLKLSIYPKIGSQTGRFNFDSFGMPSALVFEFERSEKFKWGIGCLYSYEMFGHFVVPMLTWDWKISDKWYFKGDFPIKGHIMYIPNDRIYTGLLMTTSTTTVRMNSDNTNNNDYLSRSYADAALFLDLGITKNIIFRVKAGYCFMRSIDQFADGDKLGVTLSAFKLGDDRTQLNSDINDVPFVQFSLFYRYHY